MIFTLIYVLLLIAWILVLLVALGVLVGRHLRRARKQQTRPVIHVVRDNQLDISEAQRRSR